MLKLERTSVMNLENAMRGARNPMNSWGRMDSFYDENGKYKLGPNDLDLAKRLRKSRQRPPQVSAPGICLSRCDRTSLLVERI